MTRFITVAALLTAVAGFAFAVTATPEIDASTGMAGITLVSGALLVLNARRKKPPLPSISVTASPSSLSSLSKFPKFSCSSTQFRSWKRGVSGKRPGDRCR